MEALFLPLVIVASTAAFFFFARYRAKQNQEVINRTWGDVAAKFGLGFRPSKSLGLDDQEIVGAFGAVQVKVWTHAEKSNNSRRYYTCYRIEHRPVGPPVKLTRQGLFSVFGQLIGRDDVEIGDPEFDEMVVVDSEYHAAVRAYLTPVRRAGVVDILETWGGAEITERAIQVRTRDIQKNPVVLGSTISHLIDVANVFAGSETADQILASAGQVGLHETVEELHNYNAENPNAVTELREAEFLVELGRRDEAAVVLDRLSDRLPADPLVDHWSQAVAQVPPVWDSRQAPIAGSPAPAQGEPDSVDQQIVIHDLFGGDRMSWELTDYFEQTYTGLAVEWAGEVTSVMSLGHDRDFDGRPGVRATVKIGAVGDRGYLSGEVHAVAAFPPGTKIERGTQISFSGQLLRVDRFGRKIYVEHARL